MKAVTTLPEGYKEIYSIDLQKDKKMSVIVNLLAALMAVAMIAPAHLLIPVNNLFDMSRGMTQYGIRLGAILVLLIAYTVLHEMVHGITMKLCGTKKVKYGFTGVYAFAGSDDYYDKRAYILIALAPVVLWGIVLAVINLLVPTDWFWVIYFIQIMNISGAAGDLFVAVRFSRFPKNILVKDYGVGMKVYSEK